MMWHCNVGDSKNQREKKHPQLSGNQEALLSAAVVCESKIDSNTVK